MIDRSYPRSQNRTRRCFNCPNCTRKFTSSFAMKRHRDEIHGNVEKLTCPNRSCKRSREENAFKRMEHLQRHRGVCEHDRDGSSPLIHRSYPASPGGSTTFQMQKQNRTADLELAVRQQYRSRLPEDVGLPSASDSQLTRDMKERYNADLAVLRERERECQRLRASLMTLGAHLQTLRDQEDTDLGQPSE